MIVRPPIYVAAKLQFHLDNGFAQVALTQSGQMTYIQTAGLPRHLRIIGSEFVIILQDFTIETTDSADDIRRIVARMTFQELCSVDRTPNDPSPI